MTGWKEIEWKPEENEPEYDRGVHCLDCGASSLDGTVFDLLTYPTPDGVEYDVECGKCGSVNTE